MQVNMKNLVSMTEANQNFSKVAKMVDEDGTAVILKNNKPRYVIIDYNEVQQSATEDDQTIEDASKKVLSKYIKAFEEISRR